MNGMQGATTGHCNLSMSSAVPSCLAVPEGTTKEDVRGRSLVNQRQMKKQCSCLSRDSWVVAEEAGAAVNDWLDRQQWKVTVHKSSVKCREKGVEVVNKGKQHEGQNIVLKNHLNPIPVPWYDKFFAKTTQAIFVWLPNHREGDSQPVSHCCRACC